ncbi:hypothetical protein GOP47_0024807 [Adiantum capillus-veneris]|uniref:phosphoserine transaminase n=1 Tax=Adiantum capillus-veneris TaxID=13818 RepID=A0A9D4U3C7_ADICA|nr:hypothetical protein GOP47_0024807 [Adiantum capillus-veneris]
MFEDNLGCSEIERFSMVMSVGLVAFEKSLSFAAMATSTSLHLQSTFLASGNYTDRSSFLNATSRHSQTHLPARTRVAFLCKAAISSPVQEETTQKSQGEDDGKVFNFSAGPATLPSSVLKQAQAELYNWRGCGMSLMEVSHRGKEFLSVIQNAESSLRSLLHIPDEYAVLFLQGGATTQFASLALNLCTPNDSADYIVSGSWSDKAVKEGQKYCSAKVAWSGNAAKYTSLPSSDDLQLTPGARFLHFCANETIHGVEFKDYPTPLGAQKNIGPSGVTIVIVRKDLLGSAQQITPAMLNYKIHADNNSLYNTPPCFGIYMCGLVFDDLLATGGLEAAERRNMEKAKLLYDAIDKSNGFFKCPVEKSVRSLMNVPFTMATPELEAEFIKEAAGQGMVQLKGHRSVGGIRASIYNAMPKAGVEKLVALMKSFQAKNAS